MLFPKSQQLEHQQSDMSFVSGKCWQTFGNQNTKDGWDTRKANATKTALFKHFRLQFAATFSTFPAS